MNAVEFVKNEGWDEAQETVKENSKQLRILSTWEVELKRLVESYEIVSKFESIADAKEAINNAPEAANEFRKLSCGTRYIKVGPRFFEYWDGSKWCRPTVPFTEENHILRFTPLVRLDQAIRDVESVGGGV
ncbi:hypothetical protein [Acinetobacter guillouiae]